MNTKHLIGHTKPVATSTTPDIATSHRLNLFRYIQALYAARKVDRGDTFNRADATLLIPQT